MIPVRTCLKSMGLTRTSANINNGAEKPFTIVTNCSILFACRSPGHAFEALDVELEIIKTILSKNIEILPKSLS